MSKWPPVPIGKLATWSGGLTPTTKNSSYWQGGTVPWISSQDVKSRILDGTSRLITTSAVDESRLSLHPAGGVAVVVRSGVLAHTFPAAYVPFPATVNQDIKIGTPLPEVDGRYLAEALRASGSAILRMCMKQGATVQSIDVDRLMAFEIPLPPLEEQKRIVAELDEAAILHSALLELNASLEVETQSLRTVVIDSSITGAGVEMPLADLCNVFVDGDWIESKDQSASGIRLVQTGNVGHGYFKPNDERARFISEETFVRLRCTEVLPGDCLVSRLPEPVGRACIVPDTGDRMITAVDCTLIRPTPKLLAEYFVYVTQTSKYSSQIQERSTGTTRTRISRKNLGQVRIPVPSIDEQEAIVRRLNALDERLSVLAGIAQARRELAGGFMPRMLTHLMEQDK